MLNYENLKLANSWAKIQSIWNLNIICGSVASVAYELTAPRSPRNFEIVMSRFIKEMIPKANDYILGTYIYECSLNDLLDVIYAELISIKEFREWNLTSLEFEHGVDPDDDQPNEWWDKSDKDFIDLDAFKQNVYCSLRRKLIERYFFEDTKET